MKFYKFAAIIPLIFLGGFKSIEQPNISTELQNEVVNCSLSVNGHIPTWLSGTLVRNGPIKVTIDEQSNAHWFDGLAMLHAFSFQEGKVNYSNKFLRTDAYHTVFNEGSLDYVGFAVDPCRSLFKHLLTLFLPTSHLALHNANVNVAKMANDYVALTELPLPVKFDIKTLDTLGVFDYEDQLPKGKSWESAHPHHDSKQKETINYLIEFGKASTYTLYRLQDGSAERSIIAQVPVAEPAYMHSFALTKNYVVLTEYPLVVNPWDLITKGQAFIKNFSWKPERGTKFIVIDRHEGNIVGEYITKPFFSFHHVNAFEEGDTLRIDSVTYEDASVITSERLYVDSHAVANNHYPSRLERFSLSLKTAEITSEVLLPPSIEFPRINDVFDGDHYTYVYVVGLSDRARDKEELLNGKALYKVNTTTKELLTWREEACFPGEPVFIAAPDAKEEDEGVVLSVILDRMHNDSFLLILDGKSFKEIGRARAPHLIPAGFHGQYFQ
jgi:carotenoid cleavage dioxygenase-like enzyme